VHCMPPSLHLARLCTTGPWWSAVLFSNTLHRCATVPSILLSIVLHRGTAVLCRVAPTTRHPNPPRTWTRLTPRHATRPANVSVCISFALVGCDGDVHDVAPLHLGVVLSIPPQGIVHSISAWHLSDEHGVAPWKRGPLSRGS
jgi:hypothetical protein